VTRYQFIRLLLVALVAFASDALATVTLLPGSNFQHTTPGVLFPNSVGVQVTDAGRPVAGATVRYHVLPMSAVSIVDTRGCSIDLGFNCTAQTDENGVAILRALSGSMQGTWTSRVFADLGPSGQYFGFAELTLFVDAPAALATVYPVSGGGQSAVIGTAYGQPLVVRIMRDGVPLANARVFFLTDRNPDFYAPGPPQVNFGGGNWSTEALTDANGYARSGAFTAGWGVGTGTLTAGISTGESTSFAFTNTGPRGDTTLDLQDMWWKPDEPGWGVAVHQKGSKLFSLLFAYDEKGDPTWRVMDDGYWSAGVGSDFRTKVGDARGSPFSAYDVSQFTLSTVGSVTLSFTGEQSGHIGGLINVPWLPQGFGGMSKSLDRWDFSNGDSTESLRGVADIWWGGDSQAGWGVSIFERPGAIFAMWFTYDDAGKPTWFVIPEGRWTSQTVFEGRIYSAKGPGWFAGTYDASKFRVTDVGLGRLRFLGPDSAEMGYSVNGRTGTLALHRFDY
jgi:hypothetical protein